MVNWLKLFFFGDLVMNFYGWSNVMDVDNDCLYVLNWDGKYLRCVDYGWDRLCGLSIDS